MMNILCDTFSSPSFNSGGFGPPPVLTDSLFLTTSFLRLWLCKSGHFFLTSLIDVQSLLHALILEYNILNKH